MTNASTLSEKKPPLINQIEFVVRIIMNMQAVSVGSFIKNMSVKIKREKSDRVCKRMSSH